MLEDATTGSRLDRKGSWKAAHAAPVSYESTLFRQPADAVEHSPPFHRLGEAWRDGSLIWPRHSPDHIPETPESGKPAKNANQFFFN
jgi:hypothetical protein